MDTGNLRQANRESSSVPNPQRASCLLAFAQISPQLARLPPPLSATVKPCLGSGEANMSGSPAGFHSLEGQAEPSISVSPRTPGIELLRAVHGAGMEFVPDITKTFGKGRVVRTVPGEAVGTREKEPE